MRSYEMNGYQRAIYDIELMYPDTSVCCLGGVIHLAPDIDTDRLLAAAGEYLRKTPAIRLQINKDGRLYVADTVREPQISVFCEDYRTEAECFMREPFVLYDSPLYFFRYIPTPNGGVGIMKMHHILGDHVALLSFFRQLEKIYNGAQYDTDTRYIDFLEKKPQADGTEYFRSRFCNAGRENIFPHPENIRAGVLRRDIGGDDAAKIIDYCHNNSLQTDSLFYAALSVYMKKTKKTDTCVFGCTVMNRGRRTLDVFGLYANTVPVFVCAEDDFLSLCRSAQAEVDAASVYAAYPLRSILSDNGINGRCFDIAVSYISMGMMLGTGLGEIEKYYNGYSEIPIRIHIMRHRRKITLHIEYMLGLFDEEYINGFTDSVLNIIKQGINGLELTAATAEDIKAYGVLNDVRHIKADMTVSRLFRQYATSFPDDTAYIYDGEPVTYKTALMMADNIAKKISGKSTAVIACGRCRYLIPAMLGAMSAGAAYMPYDPHRSIPEGYDCVLSLRRSGIKNAIALDGINYEKTDFEDVSRPDGTAYHMQTSGSTGEAKTVRISNEALYIRLKWMHDKYGLDKRILQKTNLTFDVSGWELLSCAFGGTVIFIRDGEERDPKRLLEYIRKYGVEMIHFVPSMLRMFAEAVPEGEALPLSDMISSGEALDASLMRLVREKLPCTELHNLYGPTECTIDVSYHDCSGDEREIPIGRPVYNTGLYVVNDEGALMPRGVTGELTVTGSLVGQGYTKGTGGYTYFNGMRAYKTGDLCRLGFDGSIYYEGRNDSQVKINGKRVDLNQIGSLAAAIPGVCGSAAVYDGNEVYLFCRTLLDASEIRTALARGTDRLPSRIFCVDELPLTDSGKLDRKALLKETEKRRSNAALPETARECDIYNAVMRVLNKDGVIYNRIDINEDIFNLGIDSISALSVAAELEKRGYEITVQDLYSKRTVYAVAKGEPAKDGFVYIKRGDSDAAVCCFPYAGGLPQSFSRFASVSDGDVLGADYACFTNAGVEEIANAAAQKLKDYDRIILASACVGSACAVETAYILEAMGKTVESIYIMGSLPANMPKGINPWRRLPESSVARIVSRLGGRETPGAFPTEQFLSDTDRFFRYMNAVKRRIKAQPYIAFAKGDRFTKGYARKQKKWNIYFEKTPVITEFDTDSHYFFEKTDDLMRKMT